MEIKPEHKRFCEQFIYDWNATRAYQVAYPKSSYEAARSSASELLTNPNIQAHIADIQKDLEKLAGISRLKVLQEHQKLAFNSIAHLHNTWIERKEFEALTDDQKSCIAEIQTRILKRNIGTKKEPDIVDVEEIKVKLYDKQKSLDSISKMLGYDAASKIQISGNEKQVIKIGDQEIEF